MILGKSVKKIIVIELSGTNNLKRKMFEEIRGEFDILVRLDVVITIKGVIGIIIPNVKISNKRFRYDIR